MTRTIATIIIAALAVIFAGTPARAATGDIAVGEADSIVYGNVAEREIWSVVIFNAGTPTMARKMYKETDRAFIMENTGDLFTDVGHAQPVVDDTLDILGADGATFYEADSEIGPGAIVVAYAGDYVYMFMAVGIDEFDGFAGWNVEVIAAETFVGVDVPYGFVEED